MKSHVAPLVAVLAALIAAAACGGTTTTSGSSGGGAGAAGTDDGGAACDPAPCDPAAGGDPAFTGPSVCTSQTTWTRGDRGSQLMHPGAACITCHATNRGPTLTIAGTVYPSGHEPDDCNGASGGQVVITDATGKVTTIAVNAAGNFYSQLSITAPFHAKVVAGGKERAMVAAQTSGDCNSCHTETGANSAPGRIVAP